MNWKIGLDRYLTTPPDDGFDSYAEQVIESFSDDFYTWNEPWIENSHTINEWMDTLFHKNKCPQESAKIIERSHQFYTRKIKLL